MRKNAIEQIFEYLPLSIRYQKRCCLNLTSAKEVRQNHQSHQNGGTNERDEMKATREDIETALFSLNTANKALKKGGLLVVSIKHTSESNMSWRFDVRVLYTNTQGQTDYLFLNWTLATLANLRQHANGEVKYNSLGTERGFEIAYLLRNLFRVHNLPEFQPRHLTIA